MPTYTIRHKVTGESFDIPWDGPIRPEDGPAIDQIVNQQRAQRASEQAAVEQAVGFIGRTPRGTGLRREAIESSIPVEELPVSFPEAFARDIGATASQTVPNILQTIGLTSQAGPSALIDYLNQNQMRRQMRRRLMESGIPEADAMAAAGPELPHETIARRMNVARRSPGMQAVEDWGRRMRDFYGYDPSGLTEAEQLLARSGGGGVGSALSFLATAPTGFTGGGAATAANLLGRGLPALAALSGGQTFAPEFTEAVESGADPSRALMQALIASGAETGSEFALGVPGRIARATGIAPQLFAGIENKLRGLTRGALANLGVSASQEAVEEMISGAVRDYSAARITGTDPNALANFWAARLEDAIGGAVGGAVLAPALRSALRDQAAREINQTIQQEGGETGASNQEERRQEGRQVREQVPSDEIGPRLTPEFLQSLSDDELIQLYESGTSGISTGSSGLTPDERLLISADVRRRLLPEPTEDLFGVSDVPFGPEAPPALLRRLEAEARLARAAAGEGAIGPAIPMGMGNRRQEALDRLAAAEAGQGVIGPAIPMGSGRFGEAQERLRLAQEGTRTIGPAIPGYNAPIIPEAPFTPIPPTLHGPAIPMGPEARPYGPAIPMGPVFTPPQLLAQEMMRRSQSRIGPTQAFPFGEPPDEFPPIPPGDIGGPPQGPTSPTPEGPAVSGGIPPVLPAQAPAAPSTPRRGRGRLRRPGTPEGAAPEGAPPPPPAPASTAPIIPDRTPDYGSVDPAVVKQMQDTADAMPPVGLAEAEDDNSWLKLMRARANEIRKIATTPETAPFKDRAIANLIMEVRESLKNPKFIEGKKRKAIKEAPYWLAKQGVAPQHQIDLLETVLFVDLGERQARHTADLVSRGDIPDVPGPASTPEEIDEYESAATLPDGQLAVVSDPDAPSPWASPVTWLRDYLSGAQPNNSKRQITTRHAFIKIDDQVYLVPVYDSGQTKDKGKTLEVGQRVKMGDPQQMGHAKSRTSVRDFGRKYGKRAQYLGTIRLPVEDADEWLPKVIWTEEEALGFLDRTKKRQADEIRNFTYPVSQGEEVTDIVEPGFLSEIDEQVPEVARLRDFINSFLPTTVPVNWTDEEIKASVVEYYRNFLRRDSASREIMDDVAQIILSGALVRPLPGALQGVAGLPTNINDLQKTKKWLEEQIAEAGLSAFRKARGEWAGQTAPDITVDPEGFRNFAIAKFLQEVLTPIKAKQETRGGSVFKRTVDRAAAALAARVAPASVSGQLPEGVRRSTPSDFQVTTDKTTSQVGGRQARRLRLAERLRQIRARAEKALTPERREELVPIEVRDIPEELRPEALQRIRRIQAQRAQAEQTGKAMVVRRRRLAGRAPTVVPKPVPTKPTPITRGTPTPAQVTAVSSAPKLKWTMEVRNTVRGPIPSWRAKSTHDFIRWLNNNRSLKGTVFQAERGTVTTPFNPEILWGTQAKATFSDTPGSQPSAYVAPPEALPLADLQRVLEGVPPPPAPVPSAVPPVIATVVPGAVPVPVSPVTPEGQAIVEGSRAKVKRAAGKKKVSKLREMGARILELSEGDPERARKLREELKKKGLKAGAAEFEAVDKAAWVADVGEAFKALRKLGVKGYVQSSDPTLTASMVMTSDGNLYLHVNQEKLNSISPEQLALVVDEEVRHAAAMVYVKEQIGPNYPGDIADEVSRRLEDTWLSMTVDQRNYLQATVEKIYGHPLNNILLPIETIRMAGQIRSGGRITEELTRKNTGSLFHRFIQGFKDWIGKFFGKEMPTPIEELYRGAETVLQRIGPAEFVSPPLEQVTQESATAAIEVRASGEYNNLDAQRLNSKRLQEILASPLLGPLGKRRTLEQAHAQAALATPTIRQNYAALVQAANQGAPAGSPAAVRRQMKDQRDAARVAIGHLNNLAGPIGLALGNIPALTSPSGWQAHQGGAWNNLPVETQLEVVHDAAGVAAVHERLTSDLWELERSMNSLLESMDRSLRALQSRLQNAPDAVVVRELLNDQLRDFREEVSQAIEWREMLDLKTSTSASNNLDVLKNKELLEGALDVLDSNEAVTHLTTLMNKLASHPQLQNINANTAGGTPVWDTNPDTFFDQLVSTGVLPGIIAADPFLAQSPVIQAAMTSPANGVRPPLKAYSGLRNLITSLQETERIRDQAISDLNTLLPTVDPAAPRGTKDPRPSLRRMLFRLQQKVANNTLEADLISRLDRQFRKDLAKAAGAETAIAQIGDVLGDQDYLKQVRLAEQTIYRGSNNIIHDVRRGSGEKSSRIYVELPPGMEFQDPAAQLPAPPPILNPATRPKIPFELSFDSRVAESERVRLRALVDQLKTWVSQNSGTADPYLLQAYGFAIPRLEQMLNPDYAISSDTIDEAGLWKFLVSGTQLPPIKHFFHPTLKFIEDALKGQHKGILSRRMQFLVRYGLWEQGREREWIKVVSALAKAKKVHGLNPGVSLRDLGGDRLSRETAAYARVIGEPLISSLQSNEGLHLQPGMYVLDLEHLISPTGMVQLKQEDLDLARTAAKYERELREFMEGIGREDPELMEAIRVIDPALPGQRERTRRSFAPGPVVMSRGVSTPFQIQEFLDEYEKAKEGVPMVGTEAGGTAMPEASRNLVRQNYLQNTLRNGGSGKTSPRVMQNVVMSHILTTDPSYLSRQNSEQRPIYDHIAQQVSRGRLNIDNWDRMILYLATQRANMLGDTAPLSDRIHKAQDQLSAEIVRGLEAISEIQAARSRQEVESREPKSSLNVQRGHLVGPAGFYQYGIWSTYDRNALHGGALRHISQGLVNAMELAVDGLREYIAREESQSAGTGTTAKRKRRAEVAYTINEAKNLMKIMEEEIQGQENFQKATRDQEQYLHAGIRLSMALFIQPLISLVTNPIGTAYDVTKTIGITATLQRRSLWGVTNWVFTPWTVGVGWMKAFTTQALATWGDTPSGKRKIRQALVRNLPWLAARVHEAGRQMAAARTQGIVRATSMSDMTHLMSLSGSISGMSGSWEFERQAGKFGRGIRMIDHLASLVGKTAFFAIGGTRTIIEDTNAMAFAGVAVRDLKLLFRRGMDALETRERQGITTRDPTHPDYTMEPQELRLSIAGLRQMRRYLAATRGLEAALMEHYDKYPGMTAAQRAEQPIAQQVYDSWVGNYVTDSQIQTLREQAPVTRTKGISGTAARFFVTFKRWATNQLYKIGRRGIDRNVVTDPLYTRWYKQGEELVILTALLMFLGGIALSAFREIRNRLGYPQGMTLSNVLNDPDWQMVMAYSAAIMVDNFPFGGLIDSTAQGVAAGDVRWMDMAPYFSSIAGIARAVNTVWSTSVGSEPESWKDALSLQAKKLMFRMVPISAGIWNMIDQGDRDYVAASRAVSKLAPKEVERRRAGAFTAPSSPAYDNVERAITLFMGNDPEGAAEEIKQGISELVAKGSSEQEAIRKWKSSVSSKDPWSSGLERKLTEEEKQEVLARSTPEQQRAILLREQAVKWVSDAAGSSGTGPTLSLGMGGYGGGISLPRLRSNQVGISRELRSLMGRPQIRSATIRRSSVIARLRSRQSTGRRRTLRRRGSASRFRALRRRVSLAD